MPILHSYFIVNSDTENTAWGAKLSTSSTGDGWTKLSNLRDVVGSLMIFALRGLGTEVIWLQSDATAAQFGVFVRKKATDAITASTTQTQGQGALVSDINIVSVCANANDTVTLPSAASGMTIYIRNNGAQTLQIFPASGDAINGGAADASVTLAAGASVTYRAADSTNWYS